MPRSRLVPDRIRRVWRIVEDIAQEPGKDRKQLASKFSLSERQVQADLDLIRRQMHLPLVRRQGYRFEPQRSGPSPILSLREAQLLLLAVRHLARARPSLQRELGALIRKLPSLFPPHLRALGDRILPSMARGRPGTSDEQSEDHIFATLSEAAVRRGQVQLHYPPHDLASPIQEPIVRVELLVPVADSWYLIGQCQQRDRLMMFDLETVRSVTPLFRP